MKILLVGASGTIGKTIDAELSKRHEIIRAGRNSGDIRVDISEATSIEQMYQQAGKVDAVVCAAGNAYFGPFDQIREEDWYIGIRSKMMGQINLVMLGRDYVQDGGSFTLTTGILAEDPIRQGAALSMVNGAVNAFVRAAAIELAKGQRINVVSSGMVEDAVEKYGPYFPGHYPIPMWKVVSGYVRSVEGAGTGQVIRIYE